jgi:purine nucleosidase
MTSQRNIWLDADPGFDDWLTMLLLASEPALHWAGLSVVAGNAPLHIILDNALRMRALHGWRVPVHAGAAQPLAGAQETAQSILGEQGMRTTGEILPHTRSQADSHDAVQAMLLHLRKTSCTTLLATGPLTNIALALQQDCAAFAKVDEIILMGGSTDRGNHTPAAEFNMYADPEAADVVFRSGVLIRMFGLNLCRQLLLTQAHVREVKSLPSAAAQIVAGYLDSYQRIRSSDGSVPMPLYDPVVALYLLQPDLFEFQAAPVDIELQGRFTRGMTVCDLRNRKVRPANVQVAMQVSSQQALELMKQRLLSRLNTNTPPQL